MLLRSTITRTPRRRHRPRGRGRLRADFIYVSFDGLAIAPDGLSVLKFLRKAPLLFHRFDPTRSPSTRFKWIAEILRFLRNLASLELHDADRIGRLPSVQDYTFGKPTVATS